MPTTAKGLVYPDSTGDVELWDHLQNLADSADTAIGNVAVDTGWITTGYTMASSHTASSFNIRAIGKIVSIVVVGTLNPAPTSNTNGDYGNVTVLTVPTAFIPSAAPASQGLAAGASGPGFTYAIAASGVISLTAGPTGAGLYSAGVSYSISGQYLL